MYETKQGETWDKIAKDVYGSEEHTGHLMQSNFLYLDIFVFPSGIKLTTPALPEEQAAIKPPWRT